jgi:hypothetical protein
MLGCVRKWGEWELSGVCSWKRSRSCGRGFESASSSEVLVALRVCSIPSTSTHSVLRVVAQAALAGGQEKDVTLSCLATALTARHVARVSTVHYSG